MSDYGEAIAKDTVRIERLLPGPIERVWAYLTESEKRASWLDRLLKVESDYQSPPTESNKT